MIAHAHPTAAITGSLETVTLIASLTYLVHLARWWAHHTTHT